MSSPNPHELKELLEEYSFKLDDYKRKFNPFFSQVSFELKEKVDLLRGRIESYAHYQKDHQLKHIVESQRAIAEIAEVHGELETLHSKIKELERIYQLGKHLS